MQDKRLAIEVGVAVLLLLVAGGIWWAKDGQVTTAREEAESRVAEAVREAEGWAAELVNGEAEAVARTFAAGIAPQVLAERQETVDQAVVGLLEVPGVIFVHVLTPDGGVIASSDRKLMATGQAGAEAGWALASSGLITRAGNRPGVLELAAPVVGATEPRGYLWLGYDTAQRLEETRPPGL